MKIQTRYFAFESRVSSEIEKDFLNRITALSKRVQIFKTGFGEFILSITAEFDANCETEIADPTDVMQLFRKQIITVKEYKRKPSPQVQWSGEWEALKD